MKNFNWIYSKKKHFFSKVLCFLLIIGSPMWTGNAYASKSIDESSQQRTITGTVADDAGEVMIGVTIKVKDMASGTFTDLDGKYSLQLPEGATALEFSFIGYETQLITIKNRTIIDVVMGPDTKMLGEVVVTALGIKRETKALGYAVTELKGDEMDINVINPIAALQGKVAGVQISGSDGGMFGSTKIQIRGASTLGKNNQPIYVVDGVILENPIHDEEVDFATNPNDYGNELKNLNPNDFESVSILKGAAASALYGSRGLNGVVVITTKGGGFQQGYGVSINQSFGIETVNTLPKFQTEFGHGSWATSNATRRANPWNTNDFEMDGEQETIMNRGNYWGPRYDGRQVIGYDGDLVPYSPNKDYYKDMFRVGTSSNTNVVVRGGNEKTTFYNSLGYHHAKGVVDNNEFDRLSNMLKASHQVSKRVRVNGGFTFAISKPKNPQLALGETASSGALGPLYNTNYYKHKYKGDNHTGMASGSYSDKYANVPNKDMWWDVYENSEMRKETSIRPTLDVEVNILDWLDFKAEANMNYYFTSNERRNLGTGYMNAGEGDGAGGMYRMSQSEKRQETVASTFMLNKQMSDFQLGGFLRGEYYNYTQQSMSAQTDGGLVIPGSFFIENSKKPKKVESRWDGKKRMLSVSAQASMSWKNQIYMDVTGRNDWSSALVKSDGTGNSSFFYPSVSGSWIFTETLKNDLPNWFSFGKLRASWAQVGNDTDAYALNTGYNLTSILQANGSNINTQDVPKKLIQNNIKPERKNAWEIGADIRFLNDRVTLDLAYYKENTKNQIMTIDKASASGVSEYLVNAGDIQNKGVEIALGLVPIRTGDWEWTVNFTYTKNTNKIISLHESAGDYIRLAGFVNEYNFRMGSVARVGGEYGTLMSDAMPKVNSETGRKVFNYSNGARIGYYQRAGEVEDIGKTINPDFLSSVATGLKWKGLTFNILFDMRFGGYMASYSNRYAMAYGLHNNSLYGRDTATGGLTYVSVHDGITYTDGIIPDGEFGAGQKSTVNGVEYNLEGLTYQEAVDNKYIDPAHASTYHRYIGDWGLGTVNDAWFSKVKYIAVREIALNYRVPNSAATKLGLRGLNLGFSGRNLGYLYNSLPNGLNPESVRGTASAEFRERGFSPNRASFTFSIGVDF